MNDELLVKHLLGETSVAESEAVMEWINSAAENQRYYQQLKQIWDASHQLAVISQVDEDRAWQKFKTHIAKGAAAKQTPVRKMILWRKVAASVLLVIGLGLAAYFISNSKNGDKMITAQTVQNVLIDTLPDGSEITLNKKSEITYQKGFAARTRAVTLKGEAFFKVAPNRERPFVITVNDTRVTVIGTSFNIKSDSSYTEVVVETGIVSVTHAGKTTRLTTGEKLLLQTGKGTAEKESVSDELYKYYRTRQFVCDETPLWKLVAVLNEAYNSNIRIGKDELKNLAITTTFNNESLEKVLEIIHLTFDITIVKKDGQIILQ